jgi:putative transferase (TIGR04331 family)
MKTDSTDINFMNIPADSAAFMELNRSDAYIEYLRKSLGSTASHMSLRVNQEVTVVHPSSVSKGKVLIYRAGLDSFSKIFLPLSSLGAVRVVKESLKLEVMKPNVTRRIEIMDVLKRGLARFDFAEWLSARVVEFLPFIFVEYFDNLSSIYMKNQCKVKVIFSTDRWSSDDSLKFLSVFSFRPDGLRPKRVGAPHALNYGALKDFWLREYELESLDRYLTWGRGYGEAEPFYIHKVQPQRKPVKPRRLQPSYEIILTGASRPGHLTEYPYTPQRYLSYLDEQIEMALSLKALTRAKVTIRTRQRDRGRSLESRMSHLGVTTLAFEYQEDKFIERIRGCLHISDNPSTAIVESLYLNQPTLIVVSNSYFELWEEAHHDFFLLEAVGVFHQSVGSLLRFFSELRCINAWWTSYDVQNAVVEFLEGQARRNPSATSLKNKLLEYAND